MRKLFKKLFITLLIISITLGCFKLNVKAALNDNGVQRLIYFVKNCKYPNNPNAEKTCKVVNNTEYSYSYINGDNANDAYGVDVSFDDKDNTLRLIYTLLSNNNKVNFVSIEYNVKNYNDPALAIVASGTAVGEEDVNYERFAFMNFSLNDYSNNTSYSFKLTELVYPYNPTGKTSTQENTTFHKGVAKINEILNRDLSISLGDLGWNKMPKSNIDKVYSFVSRLYSLCLNRKADQGGLNYYVHNLCTGDFTAAQVVKNFYNSPEMKNLNLNDQQFIERCYKAMMDRNSDTGGLSYWKDILSKGVSRIYVVRGFVESQEFTNICKNYGVTKGSVILDENRDLNIGVTEFIARCYTKALGREFDVGGLNYHTGTINSAPNKKQTAVDIASSGFFNSPEFLNKNTKDDDFIKICYRTFLGREAEASGLQYYREQLKKYPRNTILQGFANSPEFTNIMAQYGIR